MTGNNRLPHPDALKDEARALRDRLGAAGTRISHGEALERLAHAMGYRDWNTLSAAARATKTTFTVGDRVAGRYLGQSFEGRVHRAHANGAGETRLTVDFDQPVDVVQFEGFSALRRRVSANILANGMTAERTSDGIPHMSIRRSGEPFGPARA